MKMHTWMKYIPTLIGVTRLALWINIGFFIGYSPLFIHLVAAAFTISGFYGVITAANSLTAKRTYHFKVFAACSAAFLAIISIKSYYQYDNSQFFLYLTQVQHITNPIAQIVLMHLTLVSRTLFTIIALSHIFTYKAYQPTLYTQKILRLLAIALLVAATLLTGSQIYIALAELTHISHIKSLITFTQYVQKIYEPLTSSVLILSPIAQNTPRVANEKPNISPAKNIISACTLGLCA